MGHLLEPAVLLRLLQGTAHGYGLVEHMANYGLEDVSLRRVKRLLLGLEESGSATPDRESEHTQGTRAVSMP